MKNDTSDLLTVCPFYLDNTSNSIVCEGLQNKSKISQHFDKKADKAFYQNCYCYKFNYNKCPICKALKEKY